MLTLQQAHIYLDSLDKSAFSFPYRINEPLFKLKEFPDPIPHTIKLTFKFNLESSKLELILPPVLGSFSRLLIIEI